MNRIDPEGLDDRKMTPSQFADGFMRASARDKLMIMGATSQGWMDGGAGGAGARNRSGQARSSSVNITSPRAARRQVMRDQGIPNTTPTQSQSNFKDMSQNPPRNVGRQQTFSVKENSGPPVVKSVQHSLSDNNHGPHFEAGTVKINKDDGTIIRDGVGRPRLNSDKSKMEY